MDKILALASKTAEAAEVFTVTSEETQVIFEANRLKRIQTKQSTTTALRVIKNGRVGFAQTAGVAGPDLVDNAVETAQFGMVAKYEFPARIVYPRVTVFDSKVAAVTDEEMVRLGNELIAAVTAHTPGILCEGGVSRGAITVQLANSRGGQAKYRKSVFGLGVEGNLIRGTDMLFVGDGDDSCHPILDTKKVSQEVIRQLELAREIAPSPSGELPVIFTSHGVGGAFLPSLMAGFNGKLVLEGASPLKGKLGQALFDSKFSLTDDPVLPYRTQSRICDDEGVPSQKTTLIENGNIAHFIYDLQTAAMAGTVSTGSGNRGRGGVPSPSPSALVITPGKIGFDAMVADIKEGLVVEQLLGAEQGNVLGGDFSGNVLLGYKILNGKLVGRVKNTMISGNVYQVLKDIAAIGKEARWVGGFLYTPAIYCPRLSVASK